MNGQESIPDTSYSLIMGGINCKLLKLILTDNSIFKVLNQGYLAVDFYVFQEIISKNWKGAVVAVIVWMLEFHLHTLNECLLPQNLSVIRSSKLVYHTVLCDKVCLSVYEFKQKYQLDMWSSWPNNWLDHTKSYWITKFPWHRPEVILACGGKPCIEILIPGTRVKIKYNQYRTANAFPTGHGGSTATGIDWTAAISTGRGPAVQNNFVHWTVTWHLATLPWPQPCNVSARGNNHRKKWPNPLVVLK